ncbi:MAG: hypothetical protein C4336_04210 [Armatimonadota bacterium]
MRWQELYPEWVEVLSTLTEAPCVVLVLGGTDVGKSTFSVLLLRLWAQHHSPVGFLDLDLGQTTFGPPTTMGWLLVREPFQRLSDLVPGGFAFLGDTTVARHPHASLAGARHVMDELMSYQPAGIVVDTCGYIGGVGGRHYKLLLTGLLRPQVVIALQRDTELEPILSALERRTDWRVERLQVPPCITRKSPPIRAHARRVAFANYFQNARSHTLSLDQVSLTGRRLGSGLPLSPERRTRLSQQLRTDILHAEIVGNSLHVIVRQPLKEAQTQLLATQIGVDRAVVLPPTAYHHLLVGLIDYHGRHFGVGLIEQIDFEARTLTILTPVVSVHPVRWVQLGFVRILPDGTDLGEPLRDG